MKFKDLLKGLGLGNRAPDYALGLNAKEGHLKRRVYQLNLLEYDELKLYYADLNSKRRKLKKRSGTLKSC